MAIKKSIRAINFTPTLFCIIFKKPLCNIFIVLILSKVRDKTLEEMNKKILITMKASTDKIKINI